jgi:ATP adenylyltransferase
MYPQAASKYFMETLWAPWRAGYILGEAPAPLADASGCIFCDKPRANDDLNQLVVARARRSFVLLNLYPYNNGHLMVAPYRHVARLSELEDGEIAEMMRVARAIEAVVQEKMSPDGFNIGLNLGKVAGAGIDAHLHLHIVPRWSGDANFMPVLAETKVIPQSLEAVWHLLHQPLQDALTTIDD